VRVCVRVCIRVYARNMNIYIYMCACQITNRNCMITSKCLLDTVESRNSIQSFCLLLEEGSSCCVFLPPTHPKWVTYKMHEQVYDNCQYLHKILCKLYVAKGTKIERR
jgi:hypothetical protein